MTLNIQEILKSTQYIFIPNKEDINSLFDEVIKSDKENYNYYFKDFPKSIEWKENFSEKEKKEIYVDVIKEYHLNIQRKNLIKLSNEIFNEIKSDKEKFDGYFKENNKQVKWKERFDNKDIDYIKNLIQNIENEIIKRNGKKVENVLEDTDILNKYLENSKFKLKNYLYSYNISEEKYVREKIIDEEIKKIYLNDNELINSIRRIINIQNNKKIKIDLFNQYNEYYIKELAKLDSLKLDIISRITDLNTIIGIIENKINKFNYKDYGLNEVKEDYGLNEVKENEINFFKLDEIRLFMILIYEDSILKEEKNESKLNFFINQFSNKRVIEENSVFQEIKELNQSLDDDNLLEKFFDEMNNRIINNINHLSESFFNKEFLKENICVLAKTNYLYKVIEELNESGEKEFVTEFFALDNNKIESLGKINDLSLFIFRLKEFAGKILFRKFFALDNDKIESLVKINDLSFVIIYLKESGGETLVSEFFAFDNNKIESLGKINKLNSVVCELKKSGGETLVRKFFAFDNNKIESLGKINDLGLAISYLNKSGEKEFVKEFFNFDNKKIESLGKINDLYNVICRLNESGKKEFVKEFFNFDNKKIESLGNIKDLYNVIEELDKLERAALVKELFNFDNYKIELLGKINYLYKVIEQLNESGGKEFVKEFFALDNNKIKSLGKINDLSLFIFRLKEFVGKTLVRKFFALDNDKIESLGKINNLDSVIYRLKELGEKEFVKEFFNFDNKKIESLGKINYLHLVIQKLNESGGEKLVRKFLIILKENDLDIINQILFDDNAKQKNNDQIVEFVQNYKIPCQLTLNDINNNNKNSSQIL